MKRSLSVLMGIGMLLLPSVGELASSASSSSAPATLYERMKNNVVRAYESDKVEPEIANFVHAYMDTINQNVTVDNVTDAVKIQDWNLCGTRSQSDPNLSVEGCNELGPRVRTLVKDENDVRKLGRTLQLVSTSYELPVSDLPSRSLQFSESMRGIVSIWSAGTGSIKTTLTGAIIRTQTVNASTMQPLLQQLADELNKLNDEQKIAAVWRYQYGVRLAQGNRAPDFPAPFLFPENAAGTEGQYLNKRWDGTNGDPNVEQKLRAIWDSIQADTFTPPLGNKETVLYVFPKDMLKDTLPDNIIVWARNGADGPNSNQPLADVGLQWQIPLEPVLPSLSKDDGSPILGGTYPPDPEQLISGTMQPIDGAGLCSDPTQQRGYLCRVFNGQGTTKLCPDPRVPPDPKKINLITCTNTGSLRTTLAGPDVCRDINYATPTPFDPNTQCTVSIRCQANCVTGVDASAVTEDKNGQGVIPICINTGDPTPTYLLMHELLHAYQKCQKPVGFNPYAGLNGSQKAAACCTVEGEAYRTECDMMEQDGVFKDANGNPILSSSGIPFTAETCAETFTNFACDKQQGFGGCFISRTYPRTFINELQTAITNNPNKVPTNCAKAIDLKTTDIRITNMITAVNQRQDVCAPGYVRAFPNRIGNNLCYIGQCVEESLELHRLVGAQSPATVGDESYPWDNPQTGSPLGNAVVNSPLTPGHLPFYQPELVVENMEQAICEQQGLPPLTPSILCSFNDAATLQHPLIDPIANAQRMVSGIQQERDSTNTALSMSLALGSRIGTSMYADYLHNASRSLADVIGTAVRLFKELTTLNFPTQMCPTDETLPLPESSSASST